ncbi:MAG: pyrroloquinoline quinone-dependent dehydrogenase [Candidatus Hydrogenedentes bacterium]|nr:pyrroloquinoline quinone-dependent dehydrogenase [Candidatus Hydrogenedentota bacterium]
MKSGNRRVNAALAVLSVSALLAPSASPQYGAVDGEWRSYGGDTGNTKYAPLDQIDRENVTDLEVVWRWKTENFGARPNFNFQATPLMVGGVLYTTAGARRDVVAIDAATGETLWMYRIVEPPRDGAATRKGSGRGVAYWSDGTDERILFITRGFRLIALDAKTGRPCPDFGEQGIVDLKEGLDRIVKGGIGSSSPPIIVGDVVVVGSTQPPFAAVKEMPPGHVRGYDPRTGERLWIFHTIPREGEVGVDTWEDDSWKYTGNTGVWTLLTADVELGYVYLAIETPTNDYYGGHRIGDNLFAESLVCLDAATGERIWHFQTVHHGIFDYDLPAAPILCDIAVDGRAIRAVAQITKQGFCFVFDRVTGEPVWPIEERAVPQTDVPGERTSPTQPFPTKPAPFEQQGVTVDDLIDFTPELRARALEILNQYRYGPLYSPASILEEDGTKGTLLVPGSQGGPNWPGAAFDPETGIIYIPSQNIPNVIALAEPDPARSNMDYIRTGPMAIHGPDGLPLFKPPWGHIVAIDLNTGEHIWSVANGVPPAYIRDHPELQGLDLSQAGQGGRAGPLVTKTLLFVGDGNGLFNPWPEAGGNMFRAYDKKTGEILAEIELPAHQTGVPMTYMLEDKQYIVVAVGAKEHPAELVALALP